MEQRPINPTARYLFGYEISDNAGDATVTNERTAEDYEDYEDEEETQSLPPVQQGQRLKIASVQVTSGKTPPPPRPWHASFA